jgi:hypothetical protein
VSQSAGPGQPPTGFRLSPDGNWWWDGTAWRSALSPDGRRRWNGYAWVGTAAEGTSAGISRGLIALIAGGVAVVLIVVSVMAYVAINAWSGAGAAPVGGGPSPNSIPCDQLEHTQVHYHAHLQIVADGNIVPISTAVGRTATCYYWLHMHTGEQGIIHIEAPADRTFTLADFFSVWSAWSGRHQLLDSTHVSTMTLTAGQTLMVYVDVDDGSGPHVYTGDPQKIVLRNHEMITLEITPPSLSSPPAYTWPDGF